MTAAKEDKIMIVLFVFFLRAIAVS
jgi:hypothetical protein